jgi:hypothetical protein
MTWVGDWQASNWGLKARCGWEWKEQGEEVGGPKDKLVSWEEHCTWGLTALLRKSYKGCFPDSFQGIDKVYMICLSRSHSPCLCHGDEASSISAASLMIQSMYWYLNFVERNSCSGVGCDAVPHYGWIVQVIETYADGNSSPWCQ